MWPSLCTQHGELGAAAGSERGPDGYPTRRAVLRAEPRSVDCGGSVHDLLVKWARMGYLYPTPGSCDRGMAADRRRAGRRYDGCASDGLQAELDALAVDRLLPRCYYPSRL